MKADEDQACRIAGPIDYNNYREDCHIEITDGQIRPYFDNLEKHLVKYIKQASYVIGCVAWLTNNPIIEALEGLHGVKIIVNKEIFLNQRMKKSQYFHYGYIRGCYNSMNDLLECECLCCNKSIKSCNNFLQVIGTRLHQLFIKGGILTCGTLNDKSRMHHKFLIFFDDKFKPQGVWTGSYNLTKNSNNSLENAIYITDHRVIQEYIKEFLAIYLISEKYSWNSRLMKDSRHLYSNCNNH